jgi:hypothetical protein
MENQEQTAVEVPTYTRGKKGSHGAIREEVAAHTRAHPLRETPTTCPECGRTFTALAYAGTTPKYCNALCEEAGRRAKTAARVTRLRERRASAGRAGGTPPTPARV